MANDQSHSAAPQERVPWSQLIAYGLGGLIPIALFNSVGQLMQLLGNISLGLSAIWLGAIMFVPRLWEAFSDPIIGHFSDNARSRWGRRRPFILIGGIAVALSFTAMWWVPRDEWIRNAFSGESAFQVFQLTFILGGLFIFFTGCAVFEIPHGALGLEMSPDPHERTRLFSAKSFLGNIFALATPWFIFLAEKEFFRGTGGDLIDGMRSVTVLIAAVLIPMSIWWFISLREPGYAMAKEQKKSSLWHDISEAISNPTFLILTAVILVLATGFNFVNNFANYITIFYLYGGDISRASTLMGVTGTVWAVSALLAVFPLNWLSRRYGKRNTLLIAIGLMCAAQLSKIVCYRPGILFEFDSPTWLYDSWLWLDHWLWMPEARQRVTVEAPYLILIPTVLLAAGMLMFFTLGSSMVGDVCDEDELKTGKRSEGLYYSVFWWFIKVGTATAIAITGFLLAFTAFNERQNVAVEAMRGDISLLKAETEKWQEPGNSEEQRGVTLQKKLDKLIDRADELRLHFTDRLQSYPEQKAHLEHLIERTESLRQEAVAMRARSTDLAANPAEAARASDALQQHVAQLKLQTPKTLFRLRLFEIGIPLGLSVVSILLTLRYPLTEARSYEIKELLKKRRAEEAGGS